MMEKIRFATAIPVFSKKKGGAERYVADLCTRLSGEGYDVHVYTEHWDEEIQGIHFHPIKAISFPKSLRLLAFAARATQEIERDKYDITLGVGNTLKADILQPHGGVHWAWFWRSLGAYDHPLVWMIKFLGRLVSPKQWVQGYIENAPYKKHFRKIIAISEMVKEDIVRWYGIPEDRIEVVYNGVDTERFHPRNRRYRAEIRKRHHIGDEIVILFVSNNFRMKGLDCLIKALAEIKRETCPPFKLMVLGRGREAPFLHLARRTGISEEIVFAGSTLEPEKYYGAADLFVHPAFYDAFSLTVLEALASGLPVIATSTTGASRIVNHKEEGFVLNKTRDLEEMKMAIRYFLDENTRQRASLLGRAKGEKHSDQANFHEMDRIFRETLRLPLPMNHKWR